MSIPVEIVDLRAALDDYGWAYLLTVRDDERPHAVAVTPTWDADELVAAVGGGTARNAAARPQVSLCYPPSAADGYSLIVDGTATVVDDDGTNVLRFAPATAVKHRPAPDGFAGSPSGCASDCLPVGEPG